MINSARRLSSLRDRGAIDIHAHFVPRTWPDLAKRFGGDNWPWLRHHGEKPSGTFGYGRNCSAMLMVGDADFRPVTLPLWDPVARLEDLDAAGIHQQVISQTPLLFQWHRDAETAAAVSRDFNDAALEIVKDPGANGRLLSLCQVPLNDVDKACEEVSRAKKCGHVGVQIGNHVGARDLDDDELVAFLQHCAEEDFPVLVHPWEMSPIGPGNRTAAYMMGWTVGMPMETHLSITRMILGGAFDRLPEKLRICFAHGGGAFPALLGRLDNAWRERSIARGKGQRPPKEYIGRFYCDSAVFDANVLRLLMETVGEDRVVYGSDYPFPLGEQKMCSLVREAPSLTEGQRCKILRGNAETWLGLKEQLRLDEGPKEAPLIAKSAQDKSDPVVIQVQSGPSAIAPSWFDEDLQNLTQRPAWSSSWRTNWFDVDLEALQLASAPRPTLEGRTSAFSSSSSRHLFASRRGFHSEARADSPSIQTGCVPNLIAGHEIYHTSGIDLVCPVTAKVRGTVANSTQQDVADAVHAAKTAMKFGSPWQSMSLDARCAALSKLADLLESKSEKFARAESADTGKPLSLARSLDIPRSIANLRFFAGFSRHVGADLRTVHGPMESMSYAHRKPVGVVAVITPWNLPLYLLTWKLAPALAMGNAVVAKPSEITPTTATMLAGLCHEAGIPDGVFNVVHGGGAVAGQALVSHPDVAAVSFTGGTTTGSQVASIAAPMFKKLSLELGGKNAAVVFDDCAFEETVAGVLRSTFLNSGQICLCSSRIFVQQRPGSDFYARFTAALVAAAKKLRVGKPDDEDTDLGPLVSSAHLKKVSLAVKDAVAEGGKILCGGGPPEDLKREGFFYAPTLIEGLHPSSQTAQNEIFGPVATLHSFETESEVPSLVNDSRYGLSASIWTESLSRAEVAEQLSVGTVWVNTWLNRELHMPFGGLKDSGVNREGGIHSVDFYSESTTVCVKRGSRSPLKMPGSLGKRCFSSTAQPLPKPLGSYVHHREVGPAPVHLIFTAGIGPRVPETDEVPGGPVTDPITGELQYYDATAQARQCFANLRRVLAGAQCSLEDVIDVQVYLIDMKRDFKAFNAVWAEEMKHAQATRTTIGVTDLPPGGRIAVEIKATATRRH